MSLPFYLLGVFWYRPMLRSAWLLIYVRVFTLVIIAKSSIETMQEGFDGLNSKFTQIEHLKRAVLQVLLQVLLKAPDV